MSGAVFWGDTVKHLSSIVNQVAYLNPNSNVHSLYSETYFMLIRG